MYATTAGPLPACVSNFDRRIVDSDGRSLRLYQVWKGNNVSLDRLLSSPSAFSFWDFTVSAFLLVFDSSRMGGGGLHCC